MNTHTHIVELENVSKHFLIPHKKSQTIREKILSWHIKHNPDVLRAVDNFSLTIKPGEFIGITGPNGSGKSTLLKLIAGIYQPTSGTINIHGKIVPFLQLGIGFNPQLSARDNVMINGSLLGIPKEKLNNEFEMILDFAGVSRFADLPIRHYSSGMQTRLAFSVAMHAQGDVYLMDEVMAVGDEAFKEKCMKQFEILKKKGKTIILVSHSMEKLRATDRVLSL